MTDRENRLRAETEFRALLRARLTPESYQEIIRLADEVGVTAVRGIVREENARLAPAKSLDLDSVYE